MTMEIIVVGLIIWLFFAIGFTIGSAKEHAEKVKDAETVSRKFRVNRRFA